MDDKSPHERANRDRQEAGSRLPDRRRAPIRRVDPLQRDAGRWSLRDFYRPLFRFRRRALVFSATVMVIVTTGLLVYPRRYRSESSLFVRLGRESVAMDPTATAGTPATVLGLNMTREAEINSILEVMGSRSLLEKVLEQVGFEKPISSELARNEAVTKLRRDIAIGSPKNTSVVVVSCQAPTPQRAQQIVAALVDVYLREHLRLNSTAGSREFFERQATYLKGQLDEVAGALRDAKNDCGLASIEGRRDALQREIQAVETQSLDTESALAASAAKIEALRAILQKLPDRYVLEYAGPHATSSGMRQKLYDLQTREQELAAKYTEEHPSLAAIRKEVREVERILVAEQPDREQATSAALLTEQSNQHALQARATSVQKQRDRLQEALSQLNEQEVGIVELERNLKVAESSYLTYVTNLEQSRVSEALRQQAISNINVVQPASLMLKPVSPKIGLTLAIALFAAALGSFGLVLLSEQLDHSLKTPEEVERYLGLPLLVSIPRLRTSPLAVEELT